MPPRVGSPRWDFITQRLRARIGTLIALALGITLIILLPFGCLFLMFPSCSTIQGNEFIYNLFFITPKDTENFCDLVHHSHVWWDIVAVVWTAAFTLIFLFFEFATAYRDVRSRTALVLGLSTGAVALSSLVTLIFGLYTHSPIFVLLAKLFLMTWIVFLDLFIIRKQSDHEAKKDFMNFLCTIDGPAALALLVALFYVALHTPPTKDSYEFHSIHGFASGGAAFILIFVNLAFAWQFFLEGGHAGDRRTA